MYILDSSEVEFSLDKLTNCYLWDAHRVLNCRSKVSSSDLEKVFLVNKGNFFKKSDFYIQKVLLIPDLPKEEIFLVENIVAEYCNNIGKIDETTLWLYAAVHQSNCLRVIVGMGKGIILSRFLPVDSNVSEEISKTITYLQRFVTERNIKIFSIWESIDIASAMTCERICLKNFNEHTLRDFLLNNNRIKPIVTHENCLEKYFHDRKIFINMVLILLVIFCVFLDRHIEETTKVVSVLQKDYHIEKNGIKLTVNSQNFSFTNQCIDSLSDLQHPLDLFSGASVMNIPFEMLTFEKNCIRIKTSLSETAFRELSKKYEMEKVSNAEYEEIGSDKELGAIICIK